VGEHVHGFHHEDPVLRRPEGDDTPTDLELFITCRNGDPTCWYAPDQNGTAISLSYVSNTWVRSWLERCGYHGLKDRLTVERPKALSRYANRPATPIGSRYAGKLTPT